MNRREFLKAAGTVIGTMAVDGLMYEKAEAQTMPTLAIAIEGNLSDPMTRVLVDTLIQKKSTLHAEIYQNTAPSQGKNTITIRVNGLRISRSEYSREHIIANAGRGAIGETMKDGIRKTTGKIDGLPGRAAERGGDVLGIIIDENVKRKDSEENFLMTMAGSISITPITKYGQQTEADAKNRWDALAPAAAASPEIFIKVQRSQRGASHNSDFLITGWWTLNGKNIDLPKEQQIHINNVDTNKPIRELEEFARPIMAKLLTEKLETVGKNWGQVVDEERKRIYGQAQLKK